MLLFICTYAAADKVDLPSAVNPDVKSAAVGHQETCINIKETNYTFDSTNKTFFNEIRSI